MSRLITAILLTALTAFGVQAAKTAKIKLTGSAYENILMTVGQTGRTEVISTFPYTFEIAKDQLPVKLRFQSENYLYFDIDVPRKPFDTTGHVYLVKVNETAMAMRAQQAAPVAVAQPQPIMGATALDHPVEGIDVTHGVNAAPVTGRRNDKTIAVIIANEEYEMAAKVDNAVNDGLAFKEYCIKTLGLPGENVKYASNLSFGKMRKTINDAIELANVMNGEASLIVYYAGHGIPDNATKDAFLMPVDADGT
ncbi:MAG: caspase family protein, partial [Muribaculaceae bacterium]|nr:caspase family protein [Muribaculaceae bacterium]